VGEKDSDALRGGGGTLTLSGLMNAGTSSKALALGGFLVWVTKAAVAELSVIPAGDTLFVLWSRCRDTGLPRSRERTTLKKEVAVKN